MCVLESRKVTDRLLGVGINAAIFENLVKRTHRTDQATRLMCVVCVASPS
jgi:hypothetical protein